MSHLKALYQADALVRIIDKVRERINVSLCANDPLFADTVRQQVAQMHAEGAGYSTITVSLFQERCVTALCDALQPSSGTNAFLQQAPLHINAMMEVDPFTSSFALQPDRLQSIGGTGVPQRPELTPEYTRQLAEYLKGQTLESSRIHEHHITMRTSAK